jgi:hypothetical protein
MLCVTERVVSLNDELGMQTGRNGCGVNCEQRQYEKNKGRSTREGRVMRGECRKARIIYA